MFKKFLCLTFVLSLFSGLTGLVYSAGIEKFDQTKYQLIQPSSLKTMYARTTTGSYRGLPLGSTYKQIIGKLGKPGVEFKKVGKHFLLFETVKNSTTPRQCDFLVLKNNKLVYFCDFCLNRGEAITSASVKNLLGDPWKDQLATEKTNGVFTRSAVSYMYGKEAGNKMCVSWFDNTLVGYCVTNISDNELTNIGMFITLFINEVERVEALSIEKGPSTKKKKTTLKKKRTTIKKKINKKRTFVRKHRVRR